MTTNTGGNGEDDTTSGEDTADATVEDSSSEDTSPRLSIPSNLWDTGLFKPAWTRPGASGTPDSPPRLKGSLLSRPEDLDPQPADADEVESAHPDAAEDEDAQDAQEVDEVDEVEQVDATPDVTAGPVEELDTPSGIDPDLVVPPALAAMAFGEELPTDPTPEPASDPAPTSAEDEVAAPATRADEDESLEPSESTETVETSESPEDTETAAAAAAADVRVIEPVVAPVPVVPAVDEILAAADEADEAVTDAEAEPEPEPDPESEQTLRADVDDESGSEEESPELAAEAEPVAQDEPEPDADPESESESELESTAERPAIRTPQESDATAVAALSPIAAAEAAARDAGAPAPEATQVSAPQDDLDQDDDATRVATPAVDATQVVVPAATASTTETPTVVASTAETVAVTTTPTASDDHPDAVGTTDGTGRRSRGVAILLAVVLVLVLVGGGWFWWQRSQDGPIRAAFADSHGAFVSASSQLQSAESLDDVAATADDFSAAVELLEETQDAADGRTSSLSASVRRAVDAELEVARAAEQLGGLAERDFTVWGAARGDLGTGLESLEGVHDDITEAGGSTEDLPTSDVVGATDTMVGQVANRSARQRTRRAAADLASAELIADLRKVGRRAGNGATQLSGAVDSLSGSDVDTAGIEAHQAVAEALGRLTRLKPATLNEWQPIRTRVDREASDLPEELGAEVTSGLEAADAMVTSAASTWAEWQDATEGARTAKEDDLEAVQDAREEIDTVLAEFEVLDENLAGYLVASTPPVPGGPTSEALTTLTEAADARDGLRTRVVTLGTPSEVAEEISALADALAVHAGTVRAAADATGACILTCQVVDTPQWQALLAQREDQAAAVTAAVQAWREGSQDALKEIRQRELPDRPKI